MLISDSHQFIFVHIRKAAGTSLRDILEQVSIPRNRGLWNKLLSRNGIAIDYHKYAFRKHSPLIEAQRSMPVDKFDQYFKFAIVRNPWERLVSEFEYTKKDLTHSRNKKVTSMSFAEFVEFQAKRYDAFQSNMLKDKDGKICMDYIGRFENLEETLSHISQKINLDCTKIPHINKIKRKSFREYYDSELVDKVSQYWQEDIKNFNYSFE